MNKTITHIIFDLGNVLIKFDGRRALMDIVGKCNVPFDVVYNFFMSSQIERDFTEGKVSEQEFFTAAREELKFDMALEEFSKHFTDIFELDTDMVALAEQLKKDYSLSILSNTNVIHFEYILKNFPMMQLFDPHIVSFREFCQKPDQRIYQKALERIGVTPQQVLFIDDLQENVHAAAQIGLQAIHFTGYSTLRERLRLLNVSNEK